MKKKVLHAGLVSAAMCAFAPAVMAQEQTQEATYDKDGVRTVRIDSVTVVATRASATTPMVYTNIGREEMAAKNYGRDMPFLLQTTPSVVATSDAGAGIGYTGIRVRGTDATRINVTVNGVPMNDAESHGLFWVNTPDIASSVGSIQLQRGVGTSTNGAGAFGGSINMQFAPPSQQAYGEISLTGGSFGTHKETVRFGSGLLGDHWTLDARLSNIHSDGYIERASVDMRSYHVQAAYHGRNSLVQLFAFGGNERTYHAWNGATADEMKEYGRRYNSCGEIGDGVYYDEQTDNYVLNNLQLHLNQKLGELWNLTAALHYYKGDGYYEEYKAGEKLSSYGLTPYEVADTPVEVVDLVRRKMMDNWFGGGVFSLNYNGGRVKASLGGAANRYDGGHYGRVMWVQNYIGTLSPEHRYYESNGTKDDANVYAKANWEAFDGLFLYGDLQYRHIGYRIKGTGDKYPGVMDIDERFDFLNPKAGVFYKINGQLTAYASVAVAHREPPRNNYTEAMRIIDGRPVLPRAERLTDYEAGANYRGKVLTAGVNFYYMLYKDQFVLTGETNEIGEALAENVPDSYRAGVELTAGVQIAPWLRWDANATLSRNRIKNYTEYVAVYDNSEDWNWQSQHVENLGTVDISYSPSIMAGSVISTKFGNFNAALLTNYVGKQFVNNSQVDALSLDAYCVSGLRADYTFTPRWVRSATLGVEVNNVFSSKYSSNGYGWSNIFEKENNRRTEDMYYFPQAPANVLVNLTVRF